MDQRANVTPVAKLMLNNIGNFDAWQLAYLIQMWHSHSLEFRPDKNYVEQVQCSGVALAALIYNLVECVKLRM